MSVSGGCYPAWRGWGKDAGEPPIFSGLVLGECCLSPGVTTSLFWVQVPDSGLAGSLSTFL